MTKDASMTEEKKATYADKIAKLLRKAESTDSQEEAEALLAKAQELMVTWAIDDEMIARAQGKQRQEKIVEEHIQYTGIFQAALYDIGRAVATNNDCRVMISTRDAQKELKSRDGHILRAKKPKRTILYVIGFESDVNRVKMLDASVQIQATAALTRWWNSRGDISWMSKMDKFKARREFLFGFARGLDSKLRAARKLGKQQAVKNEAARHGGTAEAAAQAEAGVALVLRSRKDQVKDWQDEKYGASLRKVRRNYQHGGYNAHAAGTVAGKSADIGSTRVGTRRELEG